jgi:predicted site-specific integrase-resolvase
MITLKEVAKRLGIAEGTVKQWVFHKKECGVLFKKIGGRLMMSEEDFKSYIDGIPYVGENKNEK